MRKNKGDKKSISENEKKSLDPSSLIPSPKPIQPNHSNQSGNSQQPVTPKPSEGEVKK